MTALQSDSRTVIMDAREIASALESPAVEAEHLLLAVARGRATPLQRVLAETGLDDVALREALDNEFAGTLAEVGIRLADFDLAATAGAARTPGWGTSAKSALKRSARIAGARGDRRITPAHIVLGVLRAPLGTVPRALQRAGIGRGDLSRRVASAL